MENTLCTFLRPVEKLAGGGTRRALCKCEGTTVLSNSLDLLWPMRLAGMQLTQRLVGLCQLRHEMKVRPLLLGQEQKEEIAALMKRADERQFTLADLRKIVEGALAPAGDDPAFVCVVPTGYRCVYTVENQTVGLVRHLSVSVMGEGKAPHLSAVLMLMEAFGFKGGFAEMAAVAPEEMDEGKVAINILQKL